MRRAAYEIGDPIAAWCGPGPSQGTLPPSAASNVGRSLVAAISAPVADARRPSRAARNRSVCVTAQAVRKPPWLQPPMPSRSGSAMPRSTAASVAAMTSSHSTVPMPPRAALAKALPWPHPAAVVGQQHRVARGREQLAPVERAAGAARGRTRPYGPPCTRTTVGAGPSGASSGRIRMPSSGCPSAPTKAKSSTAPRRTPGQRLVVVRQHRQRRPAARPTPRSGCVGVGGHRGHDRAVAVTTTSTSSTSPAAVHSGSRAPVAGRTTRAGCRDPRRPHDHRSLPAGTTDAGRAPRLVGPGREHRRVARRRRHRPDGGGRAGRQVVRRDAHQPAAVADPGEAVGVRQVDQPARLADPSAASTQMLDLRACRRGRSSAGRSRPARRPVRRPRDLDRVQVGREQGGRVATRRGRRAAPGCHWRRSPKTSASSRSSSRRSSSSSGSSGASTAIDRPSGAQAYASTERLRTSTGAASPPADVEHVQAGRAALGAVGAERRAGSRPATTAAGCPRRRGSTGGPTPGSPTSATQIAALGVLVGLAVRRRRPRDPAAVGREPHVRGAPGRGDQLGRQLVVGVRACRAGYARLRSCQSRASASRIPCSASSPSFLNGRLSSGSANNGCTKRSQLVKSNSAR